jgi:hypothetical protein
MTNSLPE